MYHITTSTTAVTATPANPIDAAYLAVRSFIDNALCKHQCTLHESCLICFPWLSITYLSVRVDGTFLQELDQVSDVVAGAPPLIRGCESPGALCDARMSSQGDALS